MVADDFSRLPIMIDNDVNNKRKRLPEYLEGLYRNLTDGPAGTAFCFFHCDLRVSHNEEGKSGEPTFFNVNSFNYFYSMSRYDDLLGCFLNLPNMETAGKNPLNFEWIEEGQLQDLQLHNWKH